MVVSHDEAFLQAIGVSRHLSLWEIAEPAASIRWPGPSI
jgi:hypothetical protein